MNKKPVIIAVSLIIAAAAFAEYRFFISKNNKPDTIQVSVSENVHQNNSGQKDKPLIVSDTEGLKYFYSGINSSEKDYQKIGNELLKTMDKIEKMYHGTITKNVDESREDNGTVYYKIKDKTFGSINDVKSYMSASVTESLQKQRYPDLTDGNKPVIKEFEDGLYIIKGDGPSKGFAWEKNENKTIKLAVTGKGEGTFTISASGYKVEIVDENGTWKVNSISGS
ncbi:hypothetical protein [Ruminococcus sp. HUN007]|uniref:hypothetical protein n=1 Tax=Ruminococcus sp. HUN007 TaxID=1514668 RepID=UPI0005D1F839|nr:hypothetical protein [Ruminococcus sp. HUN007]